MEDTESFVDTRSDRLDHWLFLIIFLVGAIPAFLVRYFFEFSAYLTSGWLLAVMGTYYYLIINTRRFRLREDKSADNLYFLGFLFTVSALIISLLKFSQNTGTEAQVANNPLVVVEDLGIGLTTTLFGLLLRVFISQQRRDPEEIEEEVRLTLADVSDRVQGDVIATGEMIEGARLLTAQILEESTEALRAQQDLSKEAMKEFRKSFDSASKRLAASTEKVCDRLDAIEISEDIFSSKLDRPLQQLDASIQDLGARVQNVELPTTVLIRQTESALTSVAAAMNEIADREISAMAVKLNETLANSISNLEKEMAVLVGNIEVPPDLISEQLRPVTQTLQSTLAELGSNTSSLMSQFQESVDANLVQLRSLQGRQTSAYDELTSLTEDSKQKFISLSAEVRNQVDAALSEVSSSLTESLKEQGSSGVELLETFSSKQIEQLERLKTSVDTVVKASENLAALTSSLETSANKQD